MGQATGEAGADDMRRGVARLPGYQRALIVVVGAFVLAFLLINVLPVSMRITAPIACPSGYDRSVVVLHHSSSSRPGSSSTTSYADLWCVFPATDRYPAPANELVSFAVLWAAAAAVGALVMGGLAFAAGSSRPT